MNKILSNENNVYKKEENITRDKNYTFNISFSFIHVFKKEHPVYKELEKRLEEVDEEIKKLNLESIKTLEHYVSMEKYLKLYISTDDKVYRICQKNQVLAMMFETQEERERRKIINNAKFIKESNNEEKTALIWMTIVHQMEKKQKFDFFVKEKEILSKIRKLYPLKKAYLDFNESCALFNKFGVFEQGTIYQRSFEKETYKTDKDWTMSIEDIYINFPEIKTIFNYKPEPGKDYGINYTSLMPNIYDLYLAASWLLADIDKELI